MATTEAGHAANRVYIDQDGDFHLNGANLYVDESGTGFSTAEFGFVDGVTAGTAAVSKALVLNSSGDITLVDGTDFTLGTTTGTKFGTTTSDKLGFYNATPIVQRSAYTQTYSTADKTHANLTTTSPSTTLILTGTNIAAKTASLTLTDAVNTNAGTVATSLDQAQKDIGTALNTIRVELAAAVADILDLKQLCNSIIDDLQALGLAA